MSPQNFLHLTNNFVVVCTRTVHLVYITDTRYIIFISLTPYSFRLRLHTTYSTESSNSTVQYAKRTLNFHCKVHVSRSINQVDLIFVTQIVPESSRCSRCNCNTAFLPLGHPVHRSSTIMRFTDLMGQTCVKQDTFRSSCFTSIDVSHDTDVSCKH